MSLLHWVSVQDCLIQVGSTNLHLIAVPHRVTQDDYYDGYFIPKGSLLIPNLWKLTHDPRVYHNPMEFKPERYLANALLAENLGRQVEPHPRETCFGFGRR